MPNQRCQSAHLFDTTLAQLKHSQVVVGLGVVVVEGQRQFEALIGQGQVRYALSGKY